AALRVRRGVRRRGRPLRHVGPEGSGDEEARGGRRREDRRLLSARGEVALPRGGRAAAEGGRRGPQHARPDGGSDHGGAAAPMNKTEGKNLRVVLYEGPGSAPLAAEDRYRAISALLQNGFEVSRPAAGG